MADMVAMDGDGYDTSGDDARRQELSILITSCRCWSAENELQEWDLARICSINIVIYQRSDTMVTTRIVK